MTDWLFVRREPDGRFVFVCDRCHGAIDAVVDDGPDVGRALADWITRAASFRDAHRHEGEAWPS